MIGIYKITNKIDNKVYIGQTVDITRRFAEHKTRAFDPASKSYNSLLYKAIRNDGIENFIFESIEKCSKRELNDREFYWITEFNSNQIEYGYNQGFHLYNSDRKPSNKLTEEQISMIIKLLTTTELSYKDIAKQCNVCENTITNINQGHNYKRQKFTYPLRKIISTINNCIDCNKEISKRAMRCEECYHKTQKSTICPQRELLKQEIRTLSFLELGRKYGISDNGIRKWCSNYKLPTTKKEIKSYSDEEWLQI